MVTVTGRHAAAIDAFKLKADSVNTNIQLPAKWRSVTAKATKPYSESFVHIFMLEPILMGELVVKSMEVLCGRPDWRDIRFENGSDTMGHPYQLAVTCKHCLKRAEKIRQAKDATA